MENRDRSLPFAVIHAYIVNDLEIWNHLYVGNDPTQAVQAVLTEGSVEEILLYDPKEPLIAFHQELLCISRYEDDFVYLKAINTQNQLSAVMSQFFEDFDEVYESEEALRQFIDDFNEAAAAGTFLSLCEQEDLLQKYMHSSENICRCNEPLNEIEKAEYALRRIGPEGIPDHLYSYLRNYSAIIAVTPYYIVCLIAGGSAMLRIFENHQEQIEKQMNESYQKHFPKEYRYRKLLLSV